METNYEKSNTVIIMVLIIMCMFIILFCCYLIYRQNIIITNESQNVYYCNKENSNNIKKRKNEQVLSSDGTTIVKEITVSSTGEICIDYQDENVEKYCMEVENAVYAYLYENEKNAYLYVIIEDGSVTKVALEENYGMRIEEEYHNLKNIVRIFETKDSVVFVDSDGSEYINGNVK